jgi:phospholipase/carboxylesterase
MSSATHLAARTHGAPLSRATAAMILLHGRGATAESILTLADAFAFPDIHYVAPQAPEGSWYPYSFLAPLGDHSPRSTRWWSA